MYRISLWIQDNCFKQKLAANVAQIIAFTLCFFFSDFFLNVVTIKCCYDKMYRISLWIQDNCFKQKLAANVAQIIAFTLCFFFSNFFLSENLTR